MSGKRKRYGAEDIIKGDPPEQSSEINITPFIDVLLVLIRYLPSGLTTSPAGSRYQPTSRDTRGAAGGTLRVLRLSSSTQPIGGSPINKQDVSLPELERRLRDVFEQRREKTMFIAGAGNLRYGEIIEVIDAARGAGVNKVGIVTEGMRKGCWSRSYWQLRLLGGGVWLCVGGGPCAPRALDEGDPQ